MERRTFLQLGSAAAVASLVPRSVAAETSLYRSAVSVDSLCYESDLKPEALEVARGAGLTGAVVDLGIYPRTPEAAMHELGVWQQRFSEHAKTIRPVLIASDFAAAKTEQRL